ncbi:TonB-dependent receptor [Parapedobacter tibetensis]|uniref:TonB-dependent receptor n=1 Tax=Parapedobacter tibetensis TaxID=2972951 RepID=UPI00214D8ECD|nr:TonB-dependent receptor plug domain-containing protein [Parapedobacter tibetensis]
MKLLSSITILFLSTLTTLAQNGELWGTVTLSSGQPVVGASVILQSGNIGTMTDERGRYSLSAIPFGDHVLVVTSLEIQPVEARVTLNEVRQRKNIIAKGNESTQLTEASVVRSSEKREIETQGFAVNVIETKEAALRNIQTNELLDRTVGVRVRQSGGLGSEVQYNLNGMTGRSVGIFIDGIEISTYGSSFNLNNIPPAMIDRIEVYKGVLPAHLSGDLLGGAINIVLKKGNTVNNMTASVSYGSFNTLQSDLSANYRNAKNGFTAKVSGFYTATDNDYEQWGKFSKYIEPNGIVTRNYRTKRFFDGYTTFGGRFELGFTDVKWADAFLVGYNIADSYKEIQHGQTMGTPYMGRTSEAQGHVLNLHYTKNDLLTQGLNLTVNGVYGNRNTYIQDTVPWAYNWDGNIRVDLNGNPIRRLGGAQQGSAPTMMDIDRQITNIRSNVSYDMVAGHRISVNHIYYTVDRQDDDLLNPLGDGALKNSNDLSKNVLSFNYEAQTFNNRLRTNLFAKIYQQSLTSIAYNGSQVDGQVVIIKDVVHDNRSNTGYGFAASYSLFPRMIIITSAERAVRMPGDNEIFGSPDQNVLASPALKPERSDNYNAGFRVGTFEFDQHKISLSTNVFWRNVKDRIMPRTNELLNNQEIEETQYINLGLAQSLGFEGELSYIYQNNLTLMVNFSKFNSLFKQEFDPATGQRMTYYNTQIPNEPFFTINGNAHYRLDDVIQQASELNLFYTLGYVHPFRTIWPVSDWFITPAQYAQNVGASYIFPNRKVIASLDIKNIFNAEVYDNFGVQKPGRAFYLKLNYTINNF